MTRLQKRLRALFEYVPPIGALLYRTKVRGHKIGDCAGRISQSRVNGGYRHIKIDRKTYPAGWVVWAYFNGSFPPEEIDHRNMVRIDDRIENLRPATRSQNCMNRVKQVGKHGYRGVKTNHKKFSASLVKDQKSYYFGVYDTSEQAARAYDAGARKYFGEFALLNFPDGPKRDWLHVSSGAF